MNLSKSFRKLVLIAAGMAIQPTLWAQQARTITLEEAVGMALKSSHGLTIKELQIEEQRAKVSEGKVKNYPSVVVNSTYQYNVNIGQLTVPQGSFGALPLGPTTVIQLPNEEKRFDLGQHHTFNAGATLYQPITQLSKIKSGTDIAKTDVLISEQEKYKISLQLTQAIEKIYYGLLINQKQREEANAKMEAARMKWTDVENAVESGKTIRTNLSGIMANIADEEQNLLRLSIQYEDYLAELKRLTAIEEDSILLQPVEAQKKEGSVEDYQTSASSHNTDIKIARLGQNKTEYAIRAARRSYVPDLGLLAGYTYQQGNLMFPIHNPYAGVTLRWNLQDIFSNKQVLNQRSLLSKQAEENLLHTQEQVRVEVEKAYRKIAHAEALIAVAQKLVVYRQEELKVEQNRRAAGMSTASELLATQALFSKAEADLLSAQLNYRLALSDLNILTGRTSR
jgi:outer membrane protein